MIMKDYTNIEKVALFMGGKKDSPDSEWVYFQELGKYYKLEDMLYDSSWEWLMPVVDRISGLDIVNDLDINYCAVFGYTTTLSPSYTTHDFGYIDEHGSTRLETTWLAVIKFIDWYIKTQPK